MDRGRIAALLYKEFAELSRNRAAWIPIAIMAFGSLVLPFLVTMLIPALAGEALTEDADMRKAIETAARFGVVPEGMAPEAAAQAFMFQQFLLFIVLIPVTGSMSIAAYSVIGEKQGRTLEPLLATPITTAELLVAKVIAAIAPSLAVMLATLALYAAAIWFLAAEGVLSALLTARTAAIVLLLGPLAGLLALQLAVMVSSRVNDPRSAQQIGVLVILPVVGILVAQFAGFFFLTLPVVLLIGAGLLLAWILLTALGVALFERETILTRWK
jgi:ABC-2 type transport system permease protein